MGRGGRAWGGSRTGETVGKGERWLDLDICSWAPEFLVTPLFTNQFTGDGNGS